MLKLKMKQKIHEHRIIAHKKEIDQESARVSSQKCQYVADQIVCEYIPGYTLTVLHTTNTLRHIMIRQLQRSPKQ